MFLPEAKLCLMIHFLPTYVDVSQIFCWKIEIIIILRSACIASKIIKASNADSNHVHYVLADYMPGNVTNSSSYSNNGRHGRIPQLKGRRVSLPPFGLATYKMQESLWMNTETGDHEKVASLFNSADSWLKQLGVEQHDFNYFKTHSR